MGSQGTADAALHHVALPAHVLRMRDESEQLGAMHLRLVKFLGGPEFGGLEPEERRDLRAQRHHMGVYLGILRKRIERAERAAARVYL